MATSCFLREIMAARTFVGGRLEYTPNSALTEVQDTQKADPRALPLLSCVTHVFASVWRTKPSNREGTGCSQMMQKQFVRRIFALPPRTRLISTSTWSGGRDCRGAEDLLSRFDGAPSQGAGPRT